MLVQGYANSEDQNISDQVLPILETPNEKFDFPVLTKDYILDLVDTVVADAGSAYTRSTIALTWDNAKCSEDGHEVVLHQKNVTRYSTWFNAELAAASRAYWQVRRRREKTVADLLFNASTFSGYTAGVSTEWSTVATATPMADAQVAITAIRNNSGLEANAAIMGITAFNNLRQCTKIVDYMKQTNQPMGLGNLPTADMLANALGVKRLLVGKGRYMTTAEGATTKTYADIWDDEYCLFAKISEGTDLESDQGVGLGRQFLWAADSPTANVMEDYDLPEERARVYRSRVNYKAKVILVQAGYLLSNITV